MLKRCVFIKDMDVRYDNEHTVVIIDDYVLRFSPNEYKVLCVLLDNGKVHDKTLANVLYQGSADPFDKKSIKKYIYNIRSRLKTHGLTISRIYNQGYVLHILEEVPMSILSNTSSDASVNE